VRGNLLKGRRRSLAAENRAGLESEDEEFKTTIKEAGEARVKDTGSIAEEGKDLVPGF